MSPKTTAGGPSALSLALSSPICGTALSIVGCRRHELEQHVERVYLGGIPLGVG